LILYTQVNAGTSSERISAIIRHYDLGLASRVRDVRSGKSTTRVDRVLKGHLEMLAAG